MLLLLGTNLHLLSTAPGSLLLLLLRLQLLLLLLLARLLLLLLLTTLTPSRAHVVVFLVLLPLVLLVVLLLSASTFPRVPPRSGRNKFLGKEILLSRQHVARSFDRPGGWGWGLGWGQGLRRWWIGDYRLGIGKVRWAGGGHNQTTPWNSVDLPETSKLRFGEWRRSSLGLSRQPLHKSGSDLRLSKRRWVFFSVPGWKLEGWRRWGAGSASLSAAGPLDHCLGSVDCQTWTTSYFCSVS